MNKLNFIFILSFLIFGVTWEKSPFTYYPKDAFETIMRKMDSVNRDNCLLKSWDELTLPTDAVGMLPVFNSLHLTPWVANRTSLLHMHNMALNRGFFYSWILQRLNKSQTDFLDLPGLQYYYLSASADLSANPGKINGSAVLFDTDCQYANWLENLIFNKTLPLFGPKAWRLDDWNDEINWLRGEPTNYTLEITDYGAGPDNNYTAAQYKFNPWIKDKEMLIDFIPDYEAANVRQQQMDFTITEVFENGSTYKQLLNFFGPPQPGVKESFQPVRFTRPFFDCRRSNKWIVASVGPVIDYMARYVPPEITNVRRPRIVGISTMELDFLRIDFNPCPVSEGNDAHYMAGVARCKPSTMCEALFGFGMARGGYQCNCMPGYRLPYYQNGPFQGVDIERATEEEYRSGFDCIPVGWTQVIPTEDGINDDYNRGKRSVVEENIDPWKDETTKWLRMHAKKAAINRYNQLTVNQIGSKLRGKFNPPKPEVEEIEVPPMEKQDGINVMHPRHPPPEILKALRRKELEYMANEKILKSRKKRSLDYVGRLSGFEPMKLPQMKALIDLVNNVSKSTCSSFTEDKLNLPGEVGYGSEKVFERQGRVALRLAHFLSSYYQNYIENERYGNLRTGKRINEEHLFGEVFANIMSDLKVIDSGVFFDHQRFINSNGTRKDLFGPYAYREAQSTQSYSGIDLGSKVFPSYTEKVWFKTIKERWGSNAYGLERFKAKPWIRSDINGSQIQRYFHYPLFYSAPKYEDGYWSNPFFDCKGFTKTWIITYSTPFFGKVGTTDKVEFLGVVTVSVPLTQLDIDQCPSSFYTPNFFKNTATCDYRTTYCTAIPGRFFTTGQYKCECRQGFEYPFADTQWFFYGQTTDKEYDNKLTGKPNRYDTLVCRESLAPTLKVSLVTWVVSLVLLAFRVSSS